MTGASRPWLATDNDGLGEYRAQVMIRLLLIGVVAALIPWTMQLLGERISRFDLMALPSMALVFFGLAVWVRQRPKAANAAQLVTLTSLAGYELVDYVQTTIPVTMKSGYASVGILWISLIFILAFMVLNDLAARVFSLIYTASLLGLTFLFVDHRSLDNQKVEVFFQIFLFNAILVGFLWVFTRFRASFGLMQRMANTDSLTELRNRRSMQTKLGKVHASGQPYALLMVDIDHFKVINDTHGHAFGDQVLRELAFVLANHVRESDAVARWGGEEFLVLLTDSSVEHATATAKRLLEKVRQTHPGGVSVTVSVGLAYRPTVDSAELETVLAWADAALYRAKNAGRDRLAVPISTQTMVLEPLRV